MFQAEIHLRQHKECVITHIAETFDSPFEVAIEELHDELVTFVMEFERPVEEVETVLADWDQVKHFEELSAGNYLVTKTSCGAYSAVDRNHGVLRRRNVIGSARRVYTVLFFRRQDLRAMIDDFSEIGTVTLGKVGRVGESDVRLTDRQREVVAAALDRGYFEWPREITSEELAEEMDISRTTMLEHLRKAESKLLSDALESTTGGQRPPRPAEPESPPTEPG
ncbi:helix-turn-helix domain-containing protein [Halobaculum sp. EA56]|uniref:helix-turn-helix domain-containing protein n=1 Tax=Halobaculum sp. EA56 TaxID=3421648 RepID=UPI003EB7F52F